MLLRNSGCFVISLDGNSKEQEVDHLVSESLSVERMKNKLQRWYMLRNVGLFSEKCFSHQGLNMELKVKNLASSDSRGCELQKEVTVKVTHQRTHQVRLPLGAGVQLHEGFLRRFPRGTD